MNNSLPFPTTLDLTPEQIEREYVNIEHSLAKDKTCHFKLTASHDWKVVDIDSHPPTPQLPLGTIGLLRRVNPPEAEIEVIAADIPRELHPADWIEQHLRNFGQQLETMRRIPSAFGDVGDLLTTFRVGETNFVARSFALKDGSRIYALNCRVAHHDYQQIAQEFLMAMQSFELVSPTGEVFSEPMAKYPISAPIKGEFLFPASWTFQADPDLPPGGTSFSLLNLRQNELVGQFTYAAIEHDQERDHLGLIENYLEQLRHNEISIQTDDSSETKVLPGKMPRWDTVVYGRRHDVAIEVRATVVEDSNAWMFFATVGPTKEADAEAHAINCRAFQLALDSFQLNSI